MFCRYCGKQIGNVEVCPYCKGQIADDNGDISVNSDENSDYTPKMEQIKNVFNHDRVLVEDSVYGGKRRMVEKREKNAAVIICAVCLALFIVLSIFTAVRFFGNKDGKLFVSAKNGLYLKIEQVPAKTSVGNIQLSGVMKSSEKEAKLVINGDNVESVSPDDGEKKWVRNVMMKPGNNKFVINVSDGEQTTGIEVINVEYEPALRFPKGTVLVKSDPADIFIRPTPGKSGSYVMLIDSSDYSTQLVCVGEEVPDGANVWCKVKTPSKGIGWVRSDIIRKK